MDPLGVGDPAEVGSYRMLARLGDGNMGRVLLGYGTDGRLVAVKRTHARVVDIEGFRERFQREVAACRRVSGHYTASFIDADADAGIPWFAATYEPGPSLRDAVRRAGALPEDAVLRLAAGLASALADIHRAGLVHRDLKPANVLLTRQGPKVIDFGVARAMEAPDGTDLTHTGMFVGTPSYMSPEQAAGEAVGPASDVFSLGTVLAMAATGSGPFEGKNFPRTVHDVMYGEPDLTGVPPRVRELIEACWGKDPAERIGPEGISAAIGRIPPSTNPWPDAVTLLITEQEDRLRGLLDGERDGGIAPTLMDDGQTLFFPARGSARAENVAEMPVAAPAPGEDPTVVADAGTTVVTDAGATLVANPADADGEPHETTVDAPSSVPPAVRPPSHGGEGRPTPARTGRIGITLVAGLAVLGLLVWVVMSVFPSGGDDGVLSENRPTTPVPATSSPTPEDFDPDTLNDADTDKTPLTAEALLPESFTDTTNGLDFTPYSRTVRDCSDAALKNTEFARILKDTGCRDVAMGQYTEESGQVLVTIMVLPLPDIAASDALYKRVRDTYHDWNWWCPSKPAPGYRACQDDTTGAAKTVWVNNHHRYLKITRAIFTDLRPEGKERLDPSALAGLDAVDLPL